MIKTTCEERGVCCNTCQEDVNMHGCSICGNPFHDDEEIYCNHELRRGISDTEHCHIKCKDEFDKEQ